LCRYLELEDALPGHQYGQGPNWRFPAIRTALTRLELDPELLNHGVKREVFLAPLASNWREYLRGETQEPSWYGLDLDDMAGFFARRWALPRVGRFPGYIDISRDNMRLSRQLEGDVPVQTILPTQVD
jgi:hypothetical protein